MPSALRGQIVLDSKSIFKKYKKELKKAEYKNNKVMAQIAVENEEISSMGTNIMGIDLGLKIPAVASTGDNKVKFLAMDAKINISNANFVPKEKNLAKLKR